MKKLRGKIAFVLVLTLVLSGIIGGKQIKKAYAHYLELEEENNYIVITKDNSTLEEVVDKYDELQSTGEETKEELKENNVMVTEIKLREANKLDENKEVIVVERDYTVKASGEINTMQENVEESNEDNSTTTDWNIDMINAKYGDNMNVTEKVKVAILDSGIEYSDRLNVVERKSFIPNELEGNEVFEDISGHGTSVAGVLASKTVEGSTLKGVNSNVLIYSAKVLDEENTAPISRVIAGIYWAIEKDVNIINISFGTKQYSKALEMAVKEATDKGILVVAAAGNEHSETIEYPAAFDNVLAVGGVNSQGAISSESSISKEIDIYAPGEKVVSLGAFDGEVIVSGTSIATPHVVGVASVLWQKDMTKSADFIKKLVIESANTSKGNGIVDLEYALEIYDDLEVEGNIEADNKTTYLNTSYLTTEDTTNYVTGSWGGNAHQLTVTNAAQNQNINAHQLKLLKWGAIYSDNSLNLQGMTTNPYFHGYNKKKAGDPARYNYLAGYIYLTRCALAGTYNQDKTDLLNTTGNILEMDEKLKLINFSGREKMANSYLKKYVLLGYPSTQENRSLLLWGMAMHTAADIYAHSSYTEYEGEMTYISHETTVLKEADNTEFVTARYASSKEVVKNVLNHYINGTEGSVEDFILDSNYYDGSFKIRNIYSYASELYNLDANQTQILQNLSKEVE